MATQSRYLKHNCNNVLFLQFPYTCETLLAKKIQRPYMYVKTWPHGPMTSQSRLLELQAYIHCNQHKHNSTSPAEPSPPTTTTMASRLLSPTLHALRTPLFVASFGASTTLFLQAYRQRYAYRLDSSPVATSPKDWSFSQYQSEASTPIVNQRGGINARAVRQLSAGSIIGKDHTGQR